MTDKDKNVTSLPKWAERFLRAICPDEFYEEIEGDRIEQFTTFNFRFDQ